MERTRIVFVGLPRFLRDVIQENVAGEPDLDIVSEYEAGVDPAAVERDAADVVLAGHDAMTEAGIRSILAADREPRVLEFSSDGKGVYELRLHRAPLGEMTPAALVQLIRKPRSSDGA